MSERCIPQPTEQGTYRFVNVTAFHAHAHAHTLTHTALTHALNEPDGLGVTKTLKTIELKRAEDDLFTADKIARLRSGARGFDARKFLRTQEKATEDARLALEVLNIDTVSESLETDTQKALDMQSALQAELDLLPVRDVEAKAKSILSGLGFTDTRLSSKVSTLSGGWRMRCQLAAALLQTTAREIFRLTEAGEVHYLETGSGALLICSHSLQSRRKQALDKIKPGGCSS